MSKKLIAVFFVLVFAASAFAQPVLKIGAASPSFVLKNLEGKNVSLSSYLGSRVIILSFFASWSKSCRQEIIFLQDLATEYKEENLKIIAVSYDRKLAELKEFVNNEGLAIEILNDTKLKTLKDFRILILPTLFVVDQSGNIHSIYVDFDENVKEAVSKEIEHLLSPAK